VSFVAASNCREEIANGKLRSIPLGPEPMVRRLGLIYRKDKALSKAALGFIEIVLDNVGKNRGPRKRSQGPRLSPDDVPPLPQEDRRIRNAMSALRRCQRASVGMFQTSTVLISAAGRTRCTVRWMRCRPGCARGS